MTHPLADHIRALATPVAQSLGLDLVQVVFHSNQRPPVMRIDIRHQDPDQDTSHEDCTAMSRALDARLEQEDPLPGNYVLEVSSPGLSSVLTSDRDFTSFKGFGVEVSLGEAIKGRTTWTGKLLGRDDEAVWLSLKGRRQSFPRPLVTKVQLYDGELT